MRRFTCLLVCLFAFIAEAKAAEFRPIIGISSCNDIVFSLHDLSGLTQISGTTYIAYGTQSEVGVEMGDYSYFLGYHFFSSRESRLENYIDHLEYATWKEQRFLLGVRWQGYSQAPFPVKPLASCAISYGRSSYKWIEVNTFYDMVYGRKINATDESWGALLELGMLFRPKVPIDLIISIQTQRFESGFNYRGHEQKHFVVVIPSLRLGMQYRFPKVRIG